MGIFTWRLIRRYDELQGVKKKSLEVALGCSDAVEMAVQLELVEELEVKQRSAGGGSNECQRCYRGGIQLGKNKDRSN